MSDMEAEGRRLLAAATQDRPEEIDLLTGFATARRRDRTRRTRGRAVLSAGVVAAGASLAAMLTVGSTVPAAAAVSSAVTRTLAQSYHATEQDSYIYTGTDPSRSYRTCTGQVDPVRHVSQWSCSNGEIVRDVGGYRYWHTPNNAHGKRWAGARVAWPPFPVAGLQGVIVATPQQMLAKIETAAKVTVVGLVAGPGWTGTRYAFSSSYTRPAEVTSGTVEVDQQGRVRKLVFSSRETGPSSVFVMTQVLTFSDFGAPVIVTPPPPDQTYIVP